MKKLTALALFALAALISAPLAAAEAPAVSIETPAVQVAAPAETPAPAVALPFAPVNLSTCTNICLGEFNSCKLDCRFQPYPGCANDCWLDYQACLAGC